MGKLIMSTKRNMIMCKRQRFNRSAGGNGLAFFFLLVLGAFTALPILYSVINAFKPLPELFTYPPRFFVQHPTLRNFGELFRLQKDMLVPIERYLVNSLFVTAAGTVLYVAVAAMAAYPLARFDFTGKKVLFQLVVLCILFRPEVTAIPQYVVMAKMHLIDTLGAVIFPILGTTFGVFLMRQFMETIPNDILEAARVDGLGEGGIFFRMVLPMVRPAMLTLVIFTFQSMWNNNGVQVIYQEKLKLLPTALQQISTAGFERAGVAAVISVILMLPPVLLFVFSQRSVIETMAYSGMKT